MEGLTTEEAIKALKEGKTLQFYDGGEWFDSFCEKGNEDVIKIGIQTGFYQYRIKPTEGEKEVVLYGDLYSFDTYSLWCYDEEKANEGYKITFKVDKNNEPTGEIRIEKV